MTFEQATTAYPHDPAHDGHADRFQGLEKLRAFSDPKMHRNVYDLWRNAGRGRSAAPAGSTVDAPASRAFIDTDESDRRHP